MKVNIYDDIEQFRLDTLPALLENETANNLFISLITHEKVRRSADWLLATVSEGEDICLAALYIEPFDLLLHERAGTGSSGAVELLARQLLHIGCAPPSVMAESGLAWRFANAFSIGGINKSHMTMVAMRLDALADYKKAPGSSRALESSDMFFAPYWERAFSEDCRVEAFTITKNVKRLMTRLGKDTHYIWEDGVPVSQAVHGRDTPNSAVINGVYTPPQYRGHGYATSVVAELAKSRFESGKEFCCLFADADNPASLKIYRRLGFYDVCEHEVIKFDTRMLIT